MNQVYPSNVERTVVTVISSGPKGDKGERDTSPYPNTIHVSGSQYSGSGDNPHLISLAITGSILPEGNGNWDLGSESNPFRDVYVTTESIKFVSKATGRVVSSLSAKDVDDLKKGRTITTQSKTLTDKDGTTESKTSFVEGTAFISSIDNDVYIKTGTNRMSLVAGGSGTGTIDIGGLKQKTNLGSTSITGSLSVTGSFTAGRLINTGSIDFVASSSQFPFKGGTVVIFDNQFHHLTDANGVYNGSFSPDSENAKNFYVGNFITSNFFNQTPEVGLMVSSSGKTYIGPYLENPTTVKKLNATLHISGNSTDWGALLVEGNVTMSGHLSASGTITGSNAQFGTINVTENFTTTNLTINETSDLTGNVTIGTNCNNSLNINSQVTASCIISCSKDIVAAGFEVGDAVVNRNIFTEGQLKLTNEGLATSGDNFQLQISQDSNGHTTIRNNKNINIALDGLQVGVNVPSAFIVGGGIIPQLNPFFIVSASGDGTQNSFISASGGQNLSYPNVIGRNVRLGNDCNDSIQLKGYVTASCGISSSGDVIAPNITASAIQTDTISIVQEADLTGDVTLGTNCNNSITLLGTVTASCIISSSENIIGANITASAIQTETINIVEGADLTGDVTLGTNCNNSIQLLGSVTASCIISSSENIIGANITASNIIADTIETSQLTAIGYDQQILYNTQSAGITFVTASDNFLYNDEQRSLFVSGSISASGIVSLDPIYAPAFIETGTGTPTIESDSNLILSASNAVVVASSPLRLKSFVNGETGSGQFTFTAGDMYFNSTNNKFYGFDGSNHVVIGSQS